MARIETDQNNTANDVEIADEPLSELAARDLIETLSGRVGLAWYIHLILVVALAIVVTGLLKSDAPVEWSDYLVLAGLVFFTVLTLGALLVMLTKPIAFDRDGITHGWVWAKQERFDWTQVTSFQPVPYMPNVAYLKLQGIVGWPVFMDCDKAEHLNDAVRIWQATRAAVRNAAADRSPQ